MALRTSLRRVAVAPLCVMLAQAPAALAEGNAHVVSGSEMLQRVTGGEGTRAASIALLEGALDEPAVRSQAAAMGVDVERVKGALTLLSDSEVQDLARRAASAQEAIAGADPATALAATVALTLIAILVLLLVLAWVDPDPICCF